MATTVPDEFWSPDNPDLYDPVVDSAASMQSVQDAFTELRTDLSAPAPEINLVSATSITTSGTTNLPIWASPGFGGSTSDSSVFSYDSTTGDIRVLRAGRYTAESRVSISPVTGSAVNVWMIRNGSPAGNLSQDPVSPHPALGGVAKVSVGSIELAVNDTLRVWVPGPPSGIGVIGGPVTLGGLGRGAGEFTVRAL